MNFKPHKIPNIDKNICNKEQVIAYNYLFSWTLNEHEKTEVLKYLYKELSAKQNGTYNELFHPIHPIKKENIDYMLVYEYIVASYDRYKETNCKIFTDYRDLASYIYLNKKGA